MFAPLPEGPLDVVGDVHGELDALRALLAHLGYDADGRHPGQNSDSENSSYPHFRPQRALERGEHPAACQQRDR